MTGTLLAAGVHDVIVVVGADAAAIRAGRRPRSGVRIIDNPDYELGQLTSLLAGLRAIDADAAAALVTLIDVPLVSAATVRKLITAQRRAAHRSCAPC